LIQSFAEEGNSSFEVILPNYLIDFRDGARSITIGRVRAALSDDVSAELGRRGINVEIKQGPQLSQSFRDRNLVLTFPRQCWVVNVAAARDNAQEEAKWLLDVAVSLLRMSYKVIGPMFPMAGDIEPHPSQTWQFKEGSVTIGKKITRAGKFSNPKSYDVDKQVQSSVSESSFVDRAKLVFDPPKGSLAERISQGLGWLTRGRQSDDRAERLLYNFTAIEALLSRDDKNAPIVQTIARNAATILTEDVAARANTARKIRKLYELRSSIVHTGNRPVPWTQTNLAQNLAEDLFWRVLPNADLSSKHDDFIEQLSFASYGSPWPRREPEDT
jgi:hypothetical protein